MTARTQAARGYRLRPAPRSRSQGRPATRIHWDRLGRIVLVIVLFAVLALYVGPAMHFLDAWRDSHAEQSRLIELREQNANLKARAASLNEPGAAEQAARKLGMVAPGERAYEVKGLRR